MIQGDQRAGGIARQIALPYGTSTVNLGALRVLSRGTRSLNGARLARGADVRCTAGRCSPMSSCAVISRTKWQRQRGKNKTNGSEGESHLNHRNDMINSSYTPQYYRTSLRKRQQEPRSSPASYTVLGSRAHPCRADCGVFHRVAEK